MKRTVMNRPVAAGDRRVITGALSVLLLTILVSYGVVPAVRQWRERAQRIDNARERIAALRGLLEQAPALDSAATHEERLLAGSPRRALHAASPALAANALQALLQDAGEGAGMVVTRVDVSSVLDSTGATGGTLAAYGDIRGVATLLHTLTMGPRVVLPTSLTVQQNSALRGAPDVVQVVVGVKAPVVID